MTYSVKEIFYTLQGEGAHTGRPAVFCRFTGCNLWSGREGDRLSAVCKFCDTDFIGTNGIHGGKYQDSYSLADKIDEIWDGNAEYVGSKYVVLTGGEPGLQVDQELVDAFHLKGFEVGIETNGTVKLPIGIDWVCVSPKSNTNLVITNGNELKVVFPQAGLSLEVLVKLPFEHRYLQPKDDDNKKKNTKEAIDMCLSNPAWKLSIQTHKILGLP